MPTTVQWDACTLSSSSMASPSELLATLTACLHVLRYYHEQTQRRLPQQHANPLKESLCGPRPDTHAYTPCGREKGHSRKASREHAAVLKALEWRFGPLPDALLVSAPNSPPPLLDPSFFVGVLDILGGWSLDDSSHPVASGGDSGKSNSGHATTKQIYRTAAQLLCFLPEIGRGDVLADALLRGQASACHSSEVAADCGVYLVPNDVEGEGETEDDEEEEEEETGEHADVGDHFLSAGSTRMSNTGVAAAAAVPPTPPHDDDSGDRSRDAVTVGHHSRAILPHPLLCCRARDGGRRATLQLYASQAYVDRLTAALAGLTTSHVAGVFPATKTCTESSRPPLPPLLFPPIHYRFEALRTVLALPTMRDAFAQLYREGGAAAGRAPALPFSVNALWPVLGDAASSCYPAAATATVWESLLCILPDPARESWSAATLAMVLHHFHPLVLSITCTQAVDSEPPSQLPFTAPEAPGRQMRGARRARLLHSNPTAWWYALFTLKTLAEVADKLSRCTPLATFSSHKSVGSSTSCPQAGGGRLANLFAQTVLTSPAVTRFCLEAIAEDAATAPNPTAIVSYPESVSDATRKSDLACSVLVAVTRNVFARTAAATTANGLSEGRGGEPPLSLPPVDTVRKLLSANQAQLCTALSRLERQQVTALNLAAVRAADMPETEDEVEMNRSSSGSRRRRDEGNGGSCKSDQKGEQRLQTAIDDPGAMRRLDDSKRSTGDVSGSPVLTGMDVGGTAVRKELLAALEDMTSQE